MRTAGPEWVISFTGYSSCDRYEILLAFSFNERQITWFKLGRSSFNLYRLNQPMWMTARAKDF